MVKLFAHRGFVAENILQNSIASLKNAQKFGFDAVEFDIWFLNSRLVLKHDEPKAEEVNTLPVFRDYFCFGNEMEYWLDFKNLDEKNCDAALLAVKKNLEEAAINLEQIYFAPFVTNYKNAEIFFSRIRKIFGTKSKLMAVCEELKTDADVKILRDFLTQNDVRYLSILHKLIDENFVKIFSDIKIFAWTVNDQQRLQELENLGITNFATDKITPNDYHGKTNLSRTQIASS